LEINQSAEELAGSTTSAGPITSTRTQKTSVVAKNEETLVLGGIMQDRELEQVSKTPLLGDIPLLGMLFRNTTKTKTKVNLVVLLTPHIVNSAADFKRLVARKLEERARVLENLAGGRSDFDRSIDYDKKPGPLAAAARIIERETRIIEPQ
jgi:general secretion pathway protein D